MAGFTTSRNNLRRVGDKGLRVGGLGLAVVLERLMTRHNHDTDTEGDRVIRLVVCRGGVDRIVSSNGKGMSYQFGNMSEGWSAVIPDELRRMAGAGSFHKIVVNKPDGVSGSYGDLTAYAVGKSTSRQERLVELCVVCVVCVDCVLYIWGFVKVKGVSRLRKSLIVNVLDVISSRGGKSNG